MPEVEARRFRRFSVHTPCFVKSPQRSARTSNIEGWTKDISRGGICFVANADWQVGTEIELAIQLPKVNPGDECVEIQCRGRIIRVASNEPGDGVEVAATIEEYSELHRKRRRTA